LPDIGDVHLFRAAVRPEFYESVDGCTDEAVVYAYDVPEKDD
jgi:hypothetical protein